MNFSVPVGRGQLVEYIGNFFTGAEQLKADGEIIFKLPKDEMKKYSETGCYRDEFVIGADDHIKVTFEIERPFFYRGMRPYTYRVLADG